MKILTQIAIALSLILLTPSLFAASPKPPTIVSITNLIKEDNKILPIVTKGSTEVLYLKKDDVFYLSVSPAYLKQLDENRDVLIKFSAGNPYKSGNFYYGVADILYGKGRKIANEIKGSKAVGWTLWNYDSKDNNKILISDENYLLITKSVKNDPLSDFVFTLFIKGKQQIISDSTGFNYNQMDYLYVDNHNDKIYFAGYLNADPSKGGIIVYDLKTQKSQIAYSSLEAKADFHSPTRIPNSPYLLYFINSYSKKGEVNRSDFYIQEIHEWKAEIDQQKQNIKNHPDAILHTIDGPANVRDNPNGKTIATINDQTLVLVLETDGDWYHILYADIDGWTYKKNLVYKTPQ
jgi:hypothetical protein